MQLSARERQRRRLEIWQDANTSSQRGFFATRKPRPQSGERWRLTRCSADAADAEERLTPIDARPPCRRGRRRSHREFAVAGDRDRSPHFALGCFRQLRLQRIKVGAERAFPDRANRAVPLEVKPERRASPAGLMSNQSIVGKRCCCARSRARVAAFLPDRRIMIDAAGAIAVHPLRR